MDGLYLIAYELEQRAPDRWTGYARTPDAVHLTLDGRRRLSISIRHHEQYDAPAVVLVDDGSDPVAVAPAANRVAAVRALCGYLGLPEKPAEPDENVIPLQRP